MAEPSLEEIQANHPDWDVRRIFGTLIAVPAGCPVIVASFASTLEEKLTGIRDAGGLVIPGRDLPGCQADQEGASE